MTDFFSKTPAIFRGMRGRIMGKVSGNWITGAHSGRACRRDEVGLLLFSLSEFVKRPIFLSVRSYF